MTRREKVQLVLFVTVLLGTAVAQIASMAHMIEAYRWANSPVMALILAGVTVIMSAVFVALAVITPPGPARTAILSGLVLLGLTEWAGNFGVGGLLVEQRMPPKIAPFFGLAPGVADRLAAFLFAGFLPVLIFIAVFAIAETGTKLLEEPRPNPMAERMLKALDREQAETPVPDRSAPGGAQ